MYLPIPTYTTPINNDENTYLAIDNYRLNIYSDILVGTYL